MAQTMREIALPEISGGLNTRDPQYAIADNQSPDMLNLWFKNKALSKREGQTLVVGGLDGRVYRISDEYNGAYAVHAGTKLYQWDGDQTAVVIKTGIADTKGIFVEFGDRLFYIDGAEIWEINDDYSVAPVVPYAPTVMINTTPDLSDSDDCEAYNLIGAGFTVKYNGNGATAVYCLPQTGLDAAAVEVSVDAVDLSEGTHFTVDRTAGTVNFGGGTDPHGAPAAGTSNVWITAYKTIAGSKNKIAGCRMAIRFGGESGGVVGGTRVFMMGNPDYPYTFWRSDLGLNVSYGMAYFPDTAEELLDQNSEPITAAVKMQGRMIIFKQNSIFSVGYAFDGEDVYYPVTECHSSIGCDVPGSVQLIDNTVVFANTRGGIYILIGYDNNMENIVKPLSANINGLLLKESGLPDACSCDYEQYYWLCTGGSVYLWDYGTAPYYNYADYDKAQRRLAWYRFDNISAYDFHAGDGLWYGGDNGIVKFTKNKNDFNEAYTAYFLSKSFDLGNPDEKKTFMYVYPSFSGDGNVKATVTVGNEERDDYMSRSFDIRSFGWDDFNWAAFTWHIIKYAKTYAIRLGMRRSAYIQIKVSNDEKDRGFGLSGLRMTYFVNRKKKR